MPVLNCLRDGKSPTFQFDLQDRNIPNLPTELQHLVLSYLSSKDTIPIPIVSKYFLPEEQTFRKVVNQIKHCNYWSLDYLNCAKRLDLVLMFLREHSSNGWSINYDNGKYFEGAVHTGDTFLVKWLLLHEPIEVDSQWFINLVFKFVVEPHCYSFDIFQLLVIHRKSVKFRDSINAKGKRSQLKILGPNKMKPTLSLNSMSFFTDLSKNIESKILECLSVEERFVIPFVASNFLPEEQSFRQVVNQIRNNSTWNLDYIDSKEKLDSCLSFIKVFSKEWDINIDNGNYLIGAIDTGSTLLIKWLLDGPTSMQIDSNSQWFLDLVLLFIVDSNWYSLEIFQQLVIHKLRKQGRV